MKRTKPLVSKAFAPDAEAQAEAVNLLVTRDVPLGSPLGTAGSEVRPASDEGRTRTSAGSYKD